MNTDLITWKVTSKFDFDGEWEGSVKGKPSTMTCTADPEAGRTRVLMSAIPEWTMAIGPMPRGRNGWTVRPKDTYAYSDFYITRFSGDRWAVPDGVVGYFYDAYGHWDPFTVEFRRTSGPGPVTGYGMREYLGGVYRGERTYTESGIREPMMVDLSEPAVSIDGRPYGPVIQWWQTADAWASWVMGSCEDPLGSSKTLYGGHMVDDIETDDRFVTTMTGRFADLYRTRPLPDPPDGTFSLSLDRSVSRMFGAGQEH